MTRIAITIPPVPNGIHPTGATRKLVTGIDRTKQGGYAVLGEFAAAGDTVELATGALLLAVDKATSGWDQRYDRHRPWSGERYAVRVPTLTAYLADPDASDGLRQLWTATYKTEKSTYGAATLNALARLLAAHPAPDDITVRVLVEARRPNAKPGSCRHCERPIGAGNGHLVGHGEAVMVEHYEQCPARTANSGAECARCGREVVGHHAHQEYFRDGGLGWVTLHRDSDCHLLVPPLPTPAEHAAQLAAENARQQESRKAEAEVRAKADARKRERAAKRAIAKAAARERAEADAARVHADGIEVVSRVETEISSKGVNRTARARLLKTVTTYADKTVVTQWTAVGAEEEHTSLHEEEARNHYRSWKWETDDRRPVRYEPVSSACPGRDVKHCDNCGSTTPQGGWMIASLGLACNEDCYTDMADERGRHDRRYHRDW